jgi:Flp pilus assembly pilin Flp
MGRRPPHERVSAAAPARVPGEGGRSTKGGERPVLGGFVAIFRRSSGETGQGLAEYALIMGLIAVVAIVALMFLGTSVSTLLSTVGVAL